MLWTPCQQGPLRQRGVICTGLFQKYDAHISAGLLFEEVEELHYGGFRTSLLFSGLHCASFGIFGDVATLIEVGS